MPYKCKQICRKRLVIIVKFNFENDGQVTDYNLSLASIDDKYKNLSTASFLFL